MEEVKSLELLYIPIEKEMESCYLDYSMSVNIGRALPDSKDGLKPSQRRIIYAMHLEKMHAGTLYKKSARAVGSVTSSFHPHGTEAVYGTMVRMTQDFSLNLPLIDGQGNFGSIDGDPPAAMRYTEVRLEKITHEMLKDLDFDTVPFKPNYDGLGQEPCILPTRFPTVIVNGSEGIGVGMATNMPPYNLNEVIDVCILLLDNPETDQEELLKIMPGPDFPTGGVIMGLAGVDSLFRTGMGSFIIRGVAEVETIGNLRRIVISEIPYQVNKSKLVERIALKVREEVIEGIAEIRDESNRKGIRIALDLKKGGLPDLILEQLYRHTQLQSSFSGQLLMIHKGKPQIMKITDTIKAFIDFRKDVVEKRIRFLLDKSRKRVNILIALHLAVENIEKVIKLIRGSGNAEQAREKLLGEKFKASEIQGFLDQSQKAQIDSDGFYHLSFIQVKGILELKLQQLTALGKEDIEKEMHTLFKEIDKYLDLLRHEHKIISIIKDELLEIQRQFPRKRRTVISSESPHMDDMALIPNEDVILTLTKRGYLKRVPLDSYRAQRRGGRGKTGMPQKEDDFLKKVLITETHGNILLFSNIGRVYKLQVYKIPVGSPTSKGRPVQNMIPLSDGERIEEIFELRAETEEKKHLIFATAKGLIRKSLLSEFVNVKRNGKTAIQLNKGDSVINVQNSAPDQNIFISTAGGKCVKFSSKGLRTFKNQNTKGIIGIRLKVGDSVVSMCPVWDDDKILSVTKTGYGKRTPAVSYRKTQRGAQGVLNIKTSSGEEVIFSSRVSHGDHIIIATNTGRVMRLKSREIRLVKGRITKGVKIFSLSKGEEITCVTCVPESVEGDS